MEEYLGYTLTGYILSDALHMVERNELMKRKVCQERQRFSLHRSSKVGTKNHQKFQMGLRDSFNISKVQYKVCMSEHVVLLGERGLTLKLLYSLGSINPTQIKKLLL